MITIASDSHLKTSTFSVVEKGQKIMRQKLNNDPEEILKFIHQFPGEKQFALEATYNWPIFYELINPEVQHFHLLHPKKLKAIIESQDKCDGHDADQLAYLTDIGYIPKAYCAEAATRQYRSLLRTLIRLSGLMASLKNRIHAIINTNTFYSQRPKNFKDLFCKRGLTFLKDLPLPEHCRFLVNQLLSQINSLERLKSSLGQHIETIDFHSKDSLVLKTVPGMGGKVLAYVVLSEIDSIFRFRNPRALIAYAGLVPKEKSSAGKIRKGKLRTDSNHFLQWAMIEAVPGALRKDRALRAYYREVKQRVNASAARIAVARKLLTAIYYVLKEHRAYFYSTIQPRVAHRVPLSA